MLRLDRVPPLLRAERTDEARALLESEKERLKGVDFGGEAQAPVSYTHLDVYKRQPLRRLGGAVGLQHRQRE